MRNSKFGGGDQKSPKQVGVTEVCLSESGDETAWISRFSVGVYFILCLISLLGDQSIQNVSKGRSTIACEYFNRRNILMQE